jgi:hypothetical protein
MKKPKLTRHTLSNGKRITIELDNPLRGIWDEATQRITVWADKDTKEHLDTLLHELIHAEFPKFREKKTYKMASSFSRMILKVYKIKRK